MNPIAIIGIGCRFPQAKEPQSFWQLLREGLDPITEVPTNRWPVEQFYHPEPATPGRMNTRWGGFIEDVEGFDAEFFQITAREAEKIDPQHRLLLEVTWEALENAQIIPSHLAGSATGVFIGISSADYLLLSGSDIANINAYYILGNTFSTSANRISYLFDFKGPSMAIDTACSSSLVALHQACQSLATGETNLGLVGGVNLILSPNPTINFSQARMMAADGRCKTFDERADGYVRSEGCGIIVLKRLEDALKDGDRIYATIKSSAVNQDGLTNGMTAPNGLSQQAVIRQALKKAGVSPAQISYIETHGTGTALGDPIEVKALKAVLLEDRPPDSTCWLGSVKANIGHLEAAAGIAGLIKVALSLQHRQIPPQLHLQKLNPYISLEGTPLKITTKLEDWTVKDQPRLAGISSFGFGGTNCHVILEEAPKTKTPSESTTVSWQILPLSAKKATALPALAQSYLNYLDTHPQVSLTDLCGTVQNSRSHFDHRLGIVAASRESLKAQLQAYIEENQQNSRSNQVKLKKNPKIAFLCTGQGSQYVGMGQQLYDTEPVFREALNQCHEILADFLENSLLTVLFSPSASEDSPLDRTAYTQPALFALEYALAQLWQSWGIKPALVMGHSVGEYVAACLAGVFSLEDGLKLIAHRGRLMQSLPEEGAMVVVRASLTQVQSMIDQETSGQQKAPLGIAAINGAENIVISGDRELVFQLSQKFEYQGIQTTPLRVSHAFHSPLMEPIIEEFKAIAESITYHPPKIPIISNLTGKLSTSDIATPDYWCTHILSPVRFAESMETLATMKIPIFLEIGAKPTLLGMGRQNLDREDIAWLPSLRADKDDRQQILASLACLYERGVTINWSQVNPHTNKNLDLPTYPFQRQRYWYTDAKIPAGTPGINLWQLVVESGQNQANQCPLDLRLEQYAAKLQAIADLTTDYIIQSLRDLGLYNQPGEIETPDSILVKGKIQPLYRPLIQRFLSRLVERGVLQKNSENQYLSPSLLPKVDIAPRLQTLEKTTITQEKHLLEFVRRGGESLTQALLGQINPVDLLFPSGSFAMAEGIYQNSPDARYCNNILQAITRTIVQNLTPHQPLRILEIGAGTGSTTSALVPILPPDRTQYWSTDLSELFLLRARQKFRNYTFINYGVLDIEREPADQGYEPQSFDLIVAANVIHATEDLGQTLAHIYSLLAPNGSLLLWELTTPHAWLDITFGLFEGWHRYKDAFRSEDSPLLSEEQWQSVLASVGFDAVAAFPEPDSPAAVLGEHIIIAQKISGEASSTTSVSQKAITPMRTLATSVQPIPGEAIDRTQLLTLNSEAKQKTFHNYLQNLLTKVTGNSITSLDEQKSLSSLGIDSLMAMELRKHLETDLAVTVPVEYFAQLTIAQFAQQVMSLLEGGIPTPLPTISQEEQGNQWFPSLSTSSTSQQRLFCFSPAGAGASLYQSWLNKFPENIEVCPIQLPGRENRLSETPLTRLKPLVENLAAAIEPYLDRPFAFFGHSVGGLIAFELTRYLRKNSQEQPSCLFVAASRPPQLPDLSNPLHNLGDAPLLEALQRWQGIPAAIAEDESAIKLYLPTIRADLAVLETYFYRQEEPLDCPIVAFGGLEDPTLNKGELTAWQQQTRRQFTLKMFSGNHFFVGENTTPIIETIIHTLNQLGA
jgi:acyl transferase domain-containing protein/surfactin synthase thioesterase subunit/SAM-dependent methyltransferase/acyl carrier protein